MCLGLQDDVARAAHMLDACPFTVASETLPQLNSRCALKEPEAPSIQRPAKSCFSSLPRPWAFAAFFRVSRVLAGSAVAVALEMNQVPLDLSQGILTQHVARYLWAAEHDQACLACLSCVALWGYRMGSSTL